MSGSSTRTSTAQSATPSTTSSSPECSFGFCSNAISAAGDRSACRNNSSCPRGQRPPAVGKRPLVPPGDAAVPRSLRRAAPGPCPGRPTRLGMPGQPLRDEYRLELLSTTLRLLAVDREVAPSGVAVSEITCREFDEKCRRADPLIESASELPSGRHRKRVDRGRSLVLAQPHVAAIVLRQVEAPDDLGQRFLNGDGNNAPESGTISPRCSRGASAKVSHTALCCVQRSMSAKWNRLTA